MLAGMVSKKESLNSVLNIFFLTLFIYLPYLTTQQCCLTFSATKKCIKCPSDTHLYRSNCILNIPNCLTYNSTDGFLCSKCQSGYQLKTDTQGQTSCEKQTIKRNFKDYQIGEQERKTDDKFILTDDFLKTRNSIIRSSKILQAVRRVFTNGTEFIIIDYENLSNQKRVFRGILEPNIVTFIFKFISFDEFDIKDLENTIFIQKIPEKPIQKSNPEIKSPIDKKEQTIKEQPANKTQITSNTTLKQAETKIQPKLEPKTQPKSEPKLDQGQTLKNNTSPNLTSQQQQKLQLEIKPPQNQTQKPKEQSKPNPQIKSKQDPIQQTIEQSKTQSKDEPKKESNKDQKQGSQPVLTPQVKPQLPQPSPGFISISSQMLQSDPIIISINTFIRRQNQQQLNNAKLQSGFQSRVGIMLQFRLYYVDLQNQIKRYQAFVTYHLFTKEVNVVSFGSLFY